CRNQFNQQGRRKLLESGEESHDIPGKRTDIFPTILKAWRLGPASPATRFFKTLDRYRSATPPGSVGAAASQFGGFRRDVAIWLRLATATVSASAQGLPPSVRRLQPAWAMVWAARYSWERQIMRRRSVIIASVLAVTATAGAAQAEQSQAWTWCVNEDKASPDLQIGGCTSVIQSGRETARNIAIAFNNRGNAWHAKKDYDRAIADYYQAIKLDPKYARAFYNRGISYGEQGKTDRAIQDYDRAIELNPQYAHAYGNRGLAYARKGDLDHAISDYDQALRSDPDDAVDYNNRGNAYFARKDYDHAAADYKEAIKHDPNYASAYNNLGNALYAKQDLEGALLQYSEAIRVDPKY